MAIRSTERAIQTDQDRKSVYVVDKENKVLRRYVDVESFTGRLRVTMNAQPPVDSANQGQKPGQ